MRIEKRREQELAKRQGNWKRTIVQGTWLIISFIIAYYLVTYMDEQRIITTGMVRNAFQLSSSVPQWAVLGGMMLVIVVIFQFVMAMGYFIASPQGRRKAGKGDMYSENRDPFERHF